MPELPPQICSYILADKSRYAYGADEIHEMPRMRKTKLAEKSSYKRRVRQIKAPHYRQVRRRRGAFLYFDIDCNARLEFLQLFDPLYLFIFCGSVDGGLLMEFSKPENLISNLVIGFFAICFLNKILE